MGHMDLGGDEQIDNLLIGLPCVPCMLLEFGLRWSDKLISSGRFWPTGCMCFCSIDDRLLHRSGAAFCGH